MSKPKIISTAGPRGPRTGRLQRRYSAKVQRNRVMRAAIRDLRRAVARGEL